MGRKTQDLNPPKTVSCRSVAYGGFTFFYQNAVKPVALLSCGENLTVSMQCALQCSFIT